MGGIVDVGLKMSTCFLTYEEGREVLRFENSYSRLYRIYELYSEMSRPDWLRLLGEEWSGCDNISKMRVALKGLLGTCGPVVEMMDSEEQSAYDKLPDVVTIYRGCGKRNMVGASWSLDRSIAEKFVLFHRYRVNDPILVTAKVKKDNILAVKLDRNEQEVITFSAQRKNVEALQVMGGTL